MKIIIDCPEQYIPEAVALVNEELKRFSSYDKLGWGWAFGGGAKARFFMRRIKDGLSCKLTAEPQ